MISLSPPTAANTLLSIATAVAEGRAGSSVVIRPLKRMLSVIAPAASLKEVDERGDGLLRALFENPVACVLEDDYFDIRGDELRLRPERNPVCLGSADREEGHRELRLRQLGKVGRGLRERREIREAGGHPVRPGVLLRVSAAIDFGNRVRLVGCEVVPEVFEVDAFATLHQRFWRRSIETEVPNPGIVVDRP